jgi:hypothetical protein
MKDDDIELVDDAFWLRRAADLVTGPASLRAEAAQKLTSTVGWLWTAYTAAMVLVSRDAVHESWRAIVVALPVALLVVAYVAATHASMPITTSFDPLDPAEVREAYVVSGVVGLRRLRTALALTTIAAVSLVLALAVLAGG